MNNDPTGPSTSSNAVELEYLTRNLSTLPAEFVNEIFGILPPSKRAMLNKHHYDLATPLLYRDIKISHPDIAFRFVAALTSALTAPVLAPQKYASGRQKPNVFVRSLSLDIVEEFSVMPSLGGLSQPLSRDPNPMEHWATVHAFEQNVKTVLASMTALEALQLRYKNPLVTPPTIPEILECAPHSLRRLETNAQYCRELADVLSGNNFSQLEELALEDSRDPQEWPRKPRMPALHRLFLKNLKPETWRVEPHEGTFEDIAMRWVKACDGLKTVVMHFSDGTSWERNRDGMGMQLRG